MRKSLNEPRRGNRKRVGEIFDWMKAYGGLRRPMARGLQRVRFPSPRYGILACIAMLQCLPAFASKEGVAVAEAVGVIVLIVAVTFIACLAGGVLYGAFKASRQGGESVLKGSAR